MQRFFLLAFCLLMSLPGAVAASKPNVLIFLADDLGWNDVGYHGSIIKTPNIDRLAREGVQLDRFYVYPVCSPTRAGLMTGRSSMRTGIIYCVIRPWESYGLPLDEHLMPQSFKAAGYQTAVIGKWHLGHSRVQFLPHSRGFDRSYGHVNGAIDYFTHIRDGGLDWARNGKSAQEQGYTTHLFGEEALRVISGRDKSKPLFLYMPFNAPHTPLQAPQELIDKYSGIQDSRRRTYAAMVDAEDTEIGRVLEALKREGMAENTLVFFFSDNGGPLNAGADNTPLRDGKGSTFEGGIRVPALIRWPARLKGSRTVTQVMSNLDLFPTLAAAAGVTPGNTKPLDGKNMWPAIESGSASPREDLFFLNSNGSEVRTAVLSGEWKLVRTIQEKDNKVSEYLFRIEEDPNEKNNLAAGHPDVVKDLTGRIEKWRKLHPPDGVRFTSRAPTGWVNPKDWAAAAKP